MKTTLSTVFLRLAFLLFFITLLCFPADTLQGASTGLLLWFQTVLPTLLPPMILADYLLRIGADRYVTKLTARPLSALLGLSKDGCYGALVGFLCGYPMGARTAASLVKERRITGQEADYLLAFSNQPSIMFLMGYLCLGLFADHDGNTLIFPLLSGIYGSAILISIFHRTGRIIHRMLCANRRLDRTEGTFSVHHAPIGIRHTQTSDSPIHNKSADSSPLSLLESSMMTSFEVMVKIGGYMMLFSIAEAYVNKLPLLCPAAKALLMGVIEMTTGSRHIAADIELPWSLALCGTVTAFGGLSGLAQTAHVVQGSGLSVGRYVLWKSLQGILTGILILLFCHP